MYVGSRWYKFDFHNHTTASDDYTRPEPTYREWLFAYMRQQVDAVIISDHNTGASIDGLKKELQAMNHEAETNGLEGFRPLSLFPGVELTSTGNVHILAVFHQDSTAVSIEQLIGRCNGSAPIPRTTNHQLVLQDGPASIISKIKQDADAICILAHIDGPKGVLKINNQVELENAFKAKPDAVELSGTLSDIINGTHRKLIADLPKVRGSDAHSLDAAGTKTCWLKMSELNFDGLKNALLDHENCVLLDTQPPAEPSLQLKKVRLKTKLCSTTDGQPVELEFNPFYNAVIGSRGTGKSTLIESIRLAMRKVHNLSPNTEHSLSNFRLQGKGMGADSQIECFYQKDGNSFRLTWRPDETTSLHTFENGEWRDEPGWSADRFGISIYSQKMLFELASDNDAFLKVCDDSRFVNKRAWTERKEQLERNYKNESITLRGLIARQKIAAELNGEIGDINRSIMQLRESSYFPIRNRLAIAENEVSIIETAISDEKEKLGSISEHLHSIAEDSPPLNPSKEFTNSMAEISVVKVQFYEQLKALIVDGLTKLEGLQNSEHLTILHDVVEAEKVNVAQEAERLREQGLDPDTLDTLISRKQVIDIDLREYTDIDARIEETKEQIRAIIEDMRKHRKNLTAMRQDFIQSLNLDGLEIKFLPLSSTPELIVKEYQTITGISAFTDKIYDTEEQTGLLREFINHTTYSHLDKVINRKYELLDIIKELHRKLISNEEIGNLDIHGSFKNKLQGLSEDILDSLMCWYPDDGIHIRYRALNNQMENLSSASPGQKGASMLQFLLSYGNDPLLLDQPEDDLDCMMLSQSVIPAIAANKQRRQLIIVSHSAPIVVNGDAEYVISMTHDRNGLRPNICGALQQRDVKDLICQQMEGGEKAFRSRFSRILT